MRKSKIFLIVSIILIIAVAIAAIIYYYGYYIKPEQVYKRLIAVGTDSLDKKIDKSGYTTHKFNAVLDMSLQSKNEKIEKEIADFINNSDINISTQTDNINKQLIMDLNVDYNKEKLLNLSTYTNLKDKETHIYLKDFLNKYLKIEVNENFYTNFEWLLSINKDEAKRNIDKLRKELINIINSENCFANNENIVIDGETKKVTKYTLKIKAEEIKNILNVLNENIGNNKFLDNKNIEVKLNFYTKGILKNNIEKIEINIYDSESNYKISIIDNVYYFEIKNKEIEYKGNFSIKRENDNNGLIDFVIEGEDGKLTLILGYTQNYNSKIEIPDVNNSTNINGLSKDEQIILLQNFEKSKLYEVIENYIN